MLTMLLAVGIAGLIVLTYRKENLRSEARPRRFQRSHRRTGALDNLYEKAGKEQHLPQNRPAPPAQHASLTAWSEQLLTAIEWKRFEELCVAYLLEQGLRAKPTRIGVDGGVDFNVFEHNGEKRVAIAQCKAWKTYTVGVGPVRELLGVMAAERVPHGIFLATSRFTREALAFGTGKNLQLIGGSEFVSLIKKMPEENQARLLAMATEGDYTTPTCPSCDVKMTLRETRKGANVGKTFWGCPNYPRCKRTFPIGKRDAASF